MIDKLKSYSPIIDNPEYDKRIEEIAEELKWYKRYIFGCWNDDYKASRFGLYEIDLPSAKNTNKRKFSLFPASKDIMHEGSYAVAWLKDKGCAYCIWSFDSEDEAQKFCDHIGRELVK